MFFKNIFVFAFTRQFTHSAEDLKEALQELTFTSLGSTEIRHFGWFNSLGKGSAEVTESNGNMLICARSEEKILPAPVIKDMVDDRIGEVELTMGRNPTKKEREQIKEDVIFELLPRAFNRVTDTHAYINTKENIIVINTSSRSKAEDLLALLRKTLGTLPVTSLSPDKDSGEIMTDWVGGNALGDQVFITNKFTLGMEAEFSSLGDESAIAKVKNQDLISNEVLAHLDSRKFVTKIALEYDETMSFMLSDDLSIKRIKFFDVIAGSDLDFEYDDLNAKMMGDFSLMSAELNRMITDLFNEFGDSAKNYLSVD